jgi:2-oxoglutarate ferredoxin oxidoreductase subunit alpha
MPSVTTIKIGGAAGQGVKSAGQLLAKLALRSGYQIYCHTEYGSLIKGGHNVIQVNVSKDPVTAPRKTTNFLVAFNQETIDRYCGELLPGAGVLIDPKASINIPSGLKKSGVCQVPLLSIAKETGSGDQGINVVAVGAITALLGGDLQLLKDVVKSAFADDSDMVVASNLKAVEGGYSYIVANLAESVGKALLPSNKVSPLMMVNGNEALALGVIAGGLKFASIYPMTPITNLLTILASYQEKYGFVFRQPEDEIAAINQAIGASYAGARSLVATSGGGFCLMTEGLGLAGMTETPLVVIEGMRPGPATGLPTWSEQGDLQFVLHAHQGEFPRIVLAPGDVEEAFYLARQSFDLAEKYRLPVIILVDKNLCESDQSCKVFDTNFSGGASRQGLRPGDGAFFITNSNEHDATGFSSDKAYDHISQTRRRMQKLVDCEKEDLPAPVLYGPAKATITIVSWGSNKGAILEALKSLPHANYLHLTWLNPFPRDSVVRILSQSERVVSIEANYSGQLANLIQEKTGLGIVSRFLKYDGRPIYPEEIVEWCL